MGHMIGRGGLLTDEKLYGIAVAEARGRDKPESEQDIRYQRRIWLQTHRRAPP